MIAWQCWGVLVGVSSHKVSTIGHPILYVQISKLRLRLNSQNSQGLNHGDKKQATIFSWHLSLCFGIDT